MKVRLPSPTVRCLAAGAVVIASIGVGAARSNPVEAAAYSVSTVDTADSPGWHASIQLDAVGNPVIAYQAAATRDLRIVHCDDRACAAGGGTITTPDSANATGEYTSLQLDAAGNPVVAYYDATATRLRVLRCDDPACAPGGDTIATPDTAGKVGRFASLVLDAAGNPVISYRDDTTLDLKILHCDDPACQPGPADTIVSADTAGDVGWYTSIQLDAAGNPVVSYHSQSAGDLKVLHCDDPACAPGGDVINTPDSVGTTGTFTSLELDAAGNPVVSYFAVTGERIKVLHCDDPVCAPGGDTIESPDSLTGVGGYTSLEIDSDGNPIVSYFDHARFDLRVARCNDPACAGGDEFIEAPDRAGSAGEWTSLALDAADRPVVAYRSEVGQSLKLAALGGVGYPVPSCAVGWWAADNAASGQLGPALTGNVGYAPAVSGPGFLFDGGRGIGSAAVPAVSDGVSVEMWVKPVNTGQVQALVSRWAFPSTDDSARAFMLWLDPSGWLLWSTDDVSTRRPLDQRVQLPQLFDGGFHHVAATWSTAGTMAIYLDGEVVGTQAAQAGPLNAAATTRFVIGGAAGSMPAPFTGIIDEPAVYSCAIPLVDIEGIYQAGPDGKAL